MSHFVARFGPNTFKEGICLSNANGNVGLINNAMGCGTRRRQEAGLDNFGFYFDYKTQNLKSKIEIADGA